MVLAFSASSTKKCPLYQSKVRAGFPSPGDEHVDHFLDINEYLISRPSATFFFRVAGEEMRQEGILPQDILVVDRSRKPLPNNFVIAVVENNFLLRQFNYQHGTPCLISPTPKAQSILLSPDSSSFIWGVVISVIRKLL